MCFGMLLCETEFDRNLLLLCTTNRLQMKACFAQPTGKPVSGWWRSQSDTDVFLFKVLA